MCYSGRLLILFTEQLLLASTSVNILLISGPGDAAWINKNCIHPKVTKQRFTEALTTGLFFT